MEQKKKVKITVGSVVRVVKAMCEGEKQYIGRLGMVVSVIGDVTLDSFFELTAKRPLKIQIGSDLIWLDEDQVQLITKEKQKVSKQPQISPKRYIVIEITDDGATAKYLVGNKIEKKSAVKRYSYDKPSDKAAAYYAVCKLFGGDLSEVVEKLTTAVASADKARDLLVDLIKGN